MIRLRASPALPCLLQRVARHVRCESTSVTGRATTALSPRWLTEVNARIGKCILFGMNSAQTEEAGAILQHISQDWRELVAGSEGFLSGESWRGLYRQEVVWGEMVGWAPYPLYCYTVVRRWLMQTPRRNL